MSGSSLTWRGRSTTRASPSIVGRPRPCSPSPDGCSERSPGRASGRSCRKQLVQLAGEGLEVGLYPSDIAISGDKMRVARARAAIASRLVATAAWMTTSAEAQEIEERLERLAAAGSPAGRPGAAAASDGEAAPVDVAAELRSIDEALAVLAVSHDEWEVLYRQRLQVERDLLAGSRPGARFPAAGRRPWRRIGTATGPKPMHCPIGCRLSSRPAGCVLTAADVALALAERRRR